MPPSAATNFFHHPNLRIFPRCSCWLKSLKPISFPRFPTKKLDSSGGFVPKKAVSGQRSRVMGSNSMVELIKMLPFRNADGEDGGGELHREDYIDGTSELSPLVVDNGLESKLNRLSKWIISALFAVVILWRHDGEAIWAAMGSVVNSILSVMLKRILNQERPIPSLKSEPGMPSSHAQSIFYIVMFTVWSIVDWLGINEISVTVTAFALAFGTYCLSYILECSRSSVDALPKRTNLLHMSWLRVSQKFHTLSQIVVGAAFGTIFAIFWFWTWNSFVEKAFVSSLWVQIVVSVGAAGFCLGFVVHVIRYWLKDASYSGGSSSGALKREIPLD